MGPHRLPSCILCGVAVVDMGLALMVLSRGAGIGREVVSSAGLHSASRTDKELTIGEKVGH